MNVLLVSDSPWVTNQVRAAMSGSHTILEIDDPYAAEEAAGTGESDVILIDLQVGSMGGMALIRSLRSAPVAGESTTAPILLLLDRSADEFLAKRSGANGWLLKPFTPQDLAEALARIVPTTVDQS